MRPQLPAQAHARKGIITVGVFLIFATCAASYAALTLFWPGTVLDRAWSVNPYAHLRLALFGKTAGIPFLLLAAALAVAAVGWFRRRLWAWRLTVAIIVMQLLGDSVNLVIGDPLGGSLGLLIASALLFYLFRPSVRSAFAR